MAVTLDSFLGTVIPILVVFFGLYLLYRPFKGMFGGLWDKIRNIGHKPEAEGFVMPTRNLQYE